MQSDILSKLDLTDYLRNDKIIIDGKEKENSQPFNHRKVRKHWYSSYVHKNFLYLHSHILKFKFTNSEYKVIGDLPPHFYLYLQHVLGENQEELLNQIVNPAHIIDGSLNGNKVES